MAKPRRLDLREEIAVCIAALVPMRKMERELADKHGVSAIAVRKQVHAVRQEMADLSDQRIKEEMGRMLARLDYLGRKADRDGELRVAVAIEAIRAKAIEVIKSKFGQRGEFIEGLSWADYAMAARRVQDMAANEKRGKITAVIGQSQAPEESTG